MKTQTLIVILLITFFINSSCIFKYKWIIDPATHDEVNLDFSDSKFDKNRIKDIILFFEFQNESFEKQVYSCMAYAATSNNKYTDYVIKKFVLKKNGKSILSGKNIKSSLAFIEQTNRNYFAKGIRIIKNEKIEVNKNTKLEMIITAEFKDQYDNVVTGTISVPLKVINVFSEEWNFPIR